jgi:hypothetical protein
LTLTARRAADAAPRPGAGAVNPAYWRGRAHYSERVGDLRTAFDEAGIADRLLVAEPGTWATRSDEA